MKKPKNALILLAGLLLGAGLVMAMGASPRAEAPPVSPKYSVQLLPGVTAIVDHAENKLYVYENTEAGADSKTTFDLNQAGKKQVVTMKSGSE